MSILLHPPQKRKDHFFSQISDEAKRKIKCKISGASWIHLHPVEGDGHVLRLFLPNDCEAKQFLNDMDEQVMEKTLENNVKWFPNALDEEKLRAYFRPSVQKHPHSTISIYVSSWKDPMVYLNGAPVDSVQELLQQNIPKTARVRAEIEPMGVCFFRQKFGVRWLLRKAWVHTNPLEEHDPMVDGCDERSEVEHAWSQELQDIQQMIENERSALLSKIHSLEETYRSFESMWLQAKAAENPVVWNEHLENLSKSIAKYRNRAVTPRM